MHIRLNIASSQRIFQNEVQNLRKRRSLLVEKRETYGNAIEVYSWSQPSFHCFDCKQVALSYIQRLPVRSFRDFENWSSVAWWVVMIIEF